MPILPAAADGPGKYSRSGGSCPQLGQPVDYRPKWPRVADRVWQRGGMGKLRAPVSRRYPERGSWWSARGREEAVRSRESLRVHLDVQVRRRRRGGWAMWETVTPSWSRSRARPVRTVFMMSRAPSASREVVRVHEKVREACVRLFRRAQEAGVLRADLDWPASSKTPSSTKPRWTRTRRSTAALATLVVDSPQRTPGSDSTRCRLRGCADPAAPVP